MTTIDAASRRVVIIWLVAVVLVLVPACYRHHGASTEATDAGVPVELDATRHLDAPGPDAGPVCDLPVIDVDARAGVRCEVLMLTGWSGLTCFDPGHRIERPGSTLLRWSGGLEPLRMFVRATAPEDRRDCRTASSDCRVNVGARWSVGEDCSCRLSGGGSSADLEYGCRASEPVAPARCYMGTLSREHSRASVWLGERTAIELHLCPPGVDPW